MSEIANLVPKPQQRKRKLESSRSSGAAQIQRELIPHIVEDKYDYPYDVGLFSRLGLHCYNLEKGTSLRLAAINKYNDELRFTRCLYYYITSEAIDTSTNSLCDFQTCVFKDFLPEHASFVAQTEISRLKG
ncbi:UPF0725 protein [Raphanus sativus]|nr:UPF0725 protein [Raphanus sativus]